ncbi:MAG: M20/M25/M40 family metallo-hydrolase [Bacillaceae bacterium]
MDINKKRLEGLISNLCKIKSITESKEEVEIAQWLYAYIQSWDYFSDKQEDVFLQEVEGDPFKRSNVVAYVKSPIKTKKTIIFINHFDVVDTNGCGSLKELAFDIENYGKALAKEQLSEEVKRDMESGEWLFGRGTMDMKGGLAIQLELIHSYTEQLGELPVNILLLGLCDEENNGAGGMEASKLVLQLQEEGLEFLAIVNSEPSITTANEKAALIQSGTIGKYLPFVYVVGKEAHVGEYEEGINGSILLAELLKRLEGHDDLREEMGDQLFSPSTCIRIRELKEHYSVTLIEKIVAYFNVLVVKRTPEEILTVFERECREAINALKCFYLKRNLKSGRHLDNVAIYRIEELISLSGSTMEQFTKLHWNEITDLKEIQDKCIKLVTLLLDELNIKGPAIVIGFLPPICPAVYAKEQDEVFNLVRAIQEQALKAYDINLQHIPIFEGICDLSQFGLSLAEKDIKTFTTNLIGWKTVYNYPFEITKNLKIPVLNIGPIGKDAHKKTERLYLPYAMDVLPFLLKDTIDIISNK